MNYGKKPKAKKPAAKNKKAAPKKKGAMPAAVLKRMKAKGKKY